VTTPLKCPSQITPVGVAASGTNKTLSLQEGVEAMTLGIRMDSILSYRGRLLIKKGRMVRMMRTVRVRPHRTIVAVKPWRVRRVVTGKRSSSLIRWIKHKRL
jgi:hypothetical protein